MRAPFDPNLTRLGGHRLAEGVFAVLPRDVGERDHVATTAGFVIGERAVLVIESLLTGHLAAQLLALLRRETAKPIRYLVNTSYHGDHCNGNFVFPAETLIVQHPATKACLDRRFEQDRAFMLEPMGHNKGIEEVVYRPADLTAADRLTIDLGGRTVEVLHFGFAQTEGDLVVWVPDARVLWVGNMIQAPAPAVSWVLGGGHGRAIGTLRRLRSFLGEEATIITGHGRPIAPAEIAYPLGYLEELDRQVKMAIDSNLSMEETVREVELAAYQAYSHYAWVHPQVNVPAAYRELAGRKA